MPERNLLGRRLIIWPITIFSSIIFIGLIFLLQAKNTSFKEIPTEIVNSENEMVKSIPFPIGVNPKNRTVEENPDITTYVNNNVASNHIYKNTAKGWFALIRAKLSDNIFYQNLASPISRTLIIQSGQRSEEITDNFAHILGWSDEDKTTFLKKIATEIPLAQNGKVYPGTYIVEKDATPDTVANVISERFDSEIRKRYTKEIESQVPLKDTLIIASLLEREANDFEDMRYISGVIWNRLFINMKLQIDATLQFARGSQKHEPWWPVPVPKDKYIDSPYNTYKNSGLPPEPIANPSIDAIIAALNPRKTDCLFYFHDNNGKFYCTKTYEEHVSMLKKVFGRGK